MRRITITMTVALLVTGSIISPALADAPDGPVHIALGDSIAAGSVANNYEVTAYAPRLNRWLRSVDCVEGGPSACPHLQLSSYAVGGATSDDLIADQLPAAVAQIVSRAADSDAGNDVAYITITIGGNDVFNPVIAACTVGDDELCADTIQTLFAQYQANLGQILVTLRTVAPNAEIAIMTYDNSLRACDQAALAPLADVVLEGGNGLPGGVNDIIRGVAGAVGGVTVVETYGLLHPEDFVGGTDCLHPDDSGHRKIARAFQAAMN